MFCKLSNQYMIMSMHYIYVHIITRGKFNECYDVQDSPLGNPSTLMDIYLHMQRQNISSPINAFLQQFLS